jgi:outer membrane lipoprotein-sorting protein
MKYIITESKLEEIIVNYLNKMYDVNNINWKYPLENDEETDDWEEDPNRRYFYKGDDEYDDRIFLWYDKEYWNVERIKMDDTVRNYYEKSPALDFENRNDLIILNGYFGDKWVPIFKKWFEDNFGVPVKSIFDVDV